MIAGKRLVQAGDYQSAISYFRRVVLINPRDAEAYDQLGWCYLRTSQFPYAITAFSSALTISPDLVSSRRGLGLTYFRLGRYRECVQTLRPTMDILVHDGPIAYAFGYSLLQQGDARAALPFLEAAARQATRDPSTLMALAQAYGKLGKVEEAEFYYEQVLQLEPKHSGALYGLLDLYRETQRHLDARQLLRSMLADAPNDTALLAQLAKENEALGLKREALATYEKLSTLLRGSQGLELHRKLANEYIKSGQIALAYPHLQEAVRQQPQDPQLRGDLAECLIALGRYREAVAEYRQATRLQPMEARWQFRLGNLLAQIGESEQALAALKAGLALDPHNENALTAVADLARKVGRPDLAREALITLAALRPNAVSIRLALSDVYRELGDIRAADVQAWEILRHQPQNTEARVRLARSAETLGDLTGAIEHLRAVQRLTPSDTQQLTSLGRLLAAEGRLQEAIEECRSLLERDPKSLSARTDLAALYIRTRQTDKARQLLLGILDDRPNSLWVMDRLARCAELEGRFDEAIRLRRSVASTAPADREYLEALVRTYEHAGQPQQACDFLTTLLATPEPPVQVVRTLVNAYRRHLGQGAALEQIRGLAALFPKRPVFQRVAAEFCAEVGLREEAIGRYARYLASRPGDYEALSVLTAICREEGKLQQCCTLLAQYVEIHPRDQRALMDLSRVSLEAGKLEQALDAATRLLEADPSQPVGYRLMADALARMYGPKKAVDNLRSWATKTSEPAAQVGVAYAYLLQGDPGQALAVLAQAVETERTEHEAAYVRGLAKDALGLHAEAVTELSRAAADPDMPPDYRASLAATLAMAGRAEDALWEYSFLVGDPGSGSLGIDGIRRLIAARAVSPSAACEALRRVGIERGPTRALVALLDQTLRPQAPADTIIALNDICDVWSNSELALAALADAYQAAGQPEQEARTLARLVDLQPATVQYQLRLARAYERAGSSNRAADTYAMVLAYDPNNQEATEALRRLLAPQQREPVAAASDVAFR